MAKRAFGELELAILHILRSGERMTVKQVHHVLNKDKYNTIMTVMSRLAEKNTLKRERIGLQYEYWLPPSNKAQSLIDQFKKKFLGIKPTEMMSYLIESGSDLSEEEISAMEEMLSKARNQKKPS